MRTLALVLLVIVLALGAASCLTETRSIGATGDGVDAYPGDAADAGPGDALGRNDGSVPQGRADAVCPVQAGAVSVATAGPADIALDPAGNSLVFGGYHEETRFGATTLLAEERGLFVAKRACDGTWLWAVSASATGQVELNAIAVDRAGNSFVTGSFGETATFGANRVTGGPGPFVAKLDPDGRWLWAVSAGVSGWDGGVWEQLGDIAVDSAGDAYVTGTLVESATFGSTTLSAEGRTELYVAKLSGAGQWLWAVSSGGAGDVAGRGIAVDPAGTVHVTGDFTGKASFGSIALDATLGIFGDYTDVLVARLSSAGEWLQAASFGGVEHTAGGVDIATDSAGQSYVAGTFRGSVSVGPSTITAAGDQAGDWAQPVDAFVAKLDGAGRWSWAASLDGIQPGAYDLPSLSVDGAGNAYLAGGRRSYDAFDVFVARVDSAGRWQWAVSGGGRLGDGARGIAVDVAGNARVVGEFERQGTFGPTTLQGGGMFVWQLGPQGE